MFALMCTRIHYYRDIFVRQSKEIEERETEGRGDERKFWVLRHVHAFDILQISLLQQLLDRERRRHVIREI